MAVRHGPEAVRGADGVLKTLDLWLEELDDPAAPRADQVVMMLAGVEPLVPVALLAHPDPADDARVDEELQAPVDGRPRDFLPLAPQPEMQLVGLEVLVPAEDLVEQIAPLGCELQPPLFQVAPEEHGFAVMRHCD